jgi:hypothetical protein
MKSLLASRKNLTTTAEQSDTLQTEKGAESNAEISKVLSQLESYRATLLQAWLALDTAGYCTQACKLERHVERINKAQLSILKYVSALDLCHNVSITADTPKLESCDYKPLCETIVAETSKHLDDLRTLLLGPSNAQLRGVMITSSLYIRKTVALLREFTCEK